MNNAKIIKFYLSTIAITDHFIFASNHLFSNLWRSRPKLDPTMDEHSW